MPINFKMKKPLLYIVLVLFLANCTTKKSVTQAPKKMEINSNYILLETTKGNMVVRLYDETPLHRDNFKKLVREGYYDSLLFHRVIKNFMIQGGDPDSKNAIPNAILGNGGPKERIPAEFNAVLFHKKGALAAARDNNPEKASSGSQFYIVKGNNVNDNMIQMFEQRKGIKYTEEQKTAYKTVGGTPHLDMDYTVFGELVKGFDVLDAISIVATGTADRPIEDVRIIKATMIEKPTDIQ